MPPDRKGGISRCSAIASAAITPVAALTAAGQTASAPVQVPAPSSEQLRLLAAFVNRIIPKDRLGSGAAESGVPEYIHSSLASSFRVRTCRRKSWPLI
jgi:hypothetical protein